MKLPCKSHAPHKPKTFEGGHKQRPSLPLPGENAPFYPKVKNWGLFGSLFGFLMKKGCLAQAHFFAKRLAAYQNARPIAQESENTKVNIRQRDRGSEIKEGRGTLWPSMFFGNFFIFCRPIMEKWNGAAGTEHGPPFEDGFFALCFVFFFFCFFLPWAGSAEVPLRLH